MRLFTGVLTGNQLFKFSQTLTKRMPLQVMQGQIFSLVKRKSIGVCDKSVITNSVFNHCHYFAFCIGLLTIRDRASLAAFWHRPVSPITSILSKETTSVKSVESNTATVAVLHPKAISNSNPVPFGKVINTNFFTAAENIGFVISFCVT